MWLTSGISRPRAATSLAAKKAISPLRKDSNVAMRSRWETEELYKLRGSIWMTREEWRRSWKPWLRGAAIGFPMGALPAGGSEIPTFLSYTAERKLASEVEALREEVESLLEARRYEGALRRLATLRPHVDAFFDGVMVMADNPAVRANRLALLAVLERLFGETADLSRLPG